MPTPKKIDFKKSRGRNRPNQVFVKNFYDEYEFEIEIFNSIKAAREKKGLSQRAFARKIGIPQSSLARLESGNMLNPTLTFLKKILIGLDLELKVCDIIVT